MNFKFLIPAILLIGALHAEPDESEDPFKTALRETWVAYEKEDVGTVNAKLREMLKIMEDKSAKQVAEVLPEEIEPWKGESLKREDLTAMGGGFSISRLYVDEKKRVAVKVVKGSPLIQPAIAFLTNEDLMKLSNVKTHRISGETAAMDGGKKLHMVLGGSIYLEFVARGEADDKDLVAVARKLDLNALEKVK